MHRLALGLTLFAALSLWTIPPAPAAEPPTDPRPTLPEYYPGAFDHVGFVNRADIRSGRISVGADWYELDSGVRVHTPATEHGSIHTLREGAPVGLAIRRDRAGEAVVVEIWVLPPGFIEPS